MIDVSLMNLFFILFLSIWARVIVLIDLLHFLNQF